ncbi:MAG: DUF3810 domain-containing protein [Clostridiales bacterium]|jgi:hypothetical protein|nr:DUF3810 domain-containing protein [Clostridiales bacterium]
MKGKKVKFKGVLIALAVLSAFFGLFVLLKENEKFSEFIAQNFTRHISGAAGRLTSAVEFSVLEAFILALIAAAFVLLVLAVIGLKKKKFKIVSKGFLIVSAIVIGGVDFYTATAGVLYYRAPISLPIYGDFDERYGAEEVEKAAESFLYDYYTLYNKLEKDEYGEVVSPYTIGELNEILKEEFKRLDGKYFFEYTPNVKSIDNVWFMDLAKIVGVAFVPFGEANIDADYYGNFIPDIAAHEIAHTKGVMREAEANLTSAYILLTSENEYLRYCGYVRYMWDLGEAVRLSDFYDDEKTAGFNRRANAFRSYGSYGRNYSEFEKNVLIPIFKVFGGIIGSLNDTYLKFFGADDGVGSYDSPSAIIDSGEIIPGTEERDGDGEVIPGTGLPVMKPEYSDLHKLFFSIYEEGYDWLTDGIAPMPKTKFAVESVDVPDGSFCFATAGGAVIAAPDGTWTLYYTTEDGENKNETIEPFFEIDFDNLSEWTDFSHAEGCFFNYGYYSLVIGKYFRIYGGATCVVVAGTVLTERVEVPDGSFCFVTARGVVITAPEGNWTLYYTTEDDENKNETIEPFFEIDFDNLSEWLTFKDGEGGSFNYGNYTFVFGDGFSPIGGVVVIID